mmetsp:Transcript_43931/g.86165  ORF Transcript_43931/g.86165 Transcript_43931/m.86165 type:complete len:120 (+) Transcript_43931:1065-1424(+)
MAYYNVGHGGGDTAGALHHEEDRDIEGGRNEKSEELGGNDDDLKVEIRIEVRNEAAVGDKLGGIGCRYQVYNLVHLEQGIHQQGQPFYLEILDIPETSSFLTSFLRRGRELQELFLLEL